MCMKRMIFWREIKYGYVNLKIPCIHLNYVIVFHYFLLANKVIMILDSKWFSIIAQMKTSVLISVKKKINRLFLNSLGFTIEITVYLNGRFDHADQKILFLIPSRKLIRLRHELSPQYSGYFSFILYDIKFLQYVT